MVNFDFIHENSKLQNLAFLVNFYEIFLKCTSLITWAIEWQLWNVSFWRRETVCVFTKCTAISTEKFEWESKLIKHLLWTNTIEWDSGKENPQLGWILMSFSSPSRLAAGWLSLQISPHLDSDLFVTKMTSLSPTSLAQEHSRKEKILILLYLSCRSD